MDLVSDPTPQYGASESAACCQAAGRANREAVRCGPSEDDVDAGDGGHFCRCAGLALLPPAPSWAPCGPLLPPRKAGLAAGA
eukprot:1629227-Pyramimonas_sp.AAC.1